MARRDDAMNDDGHIITTASRELVDQTELADTAHLAVEVARFMLRLKAEGMTDIDAFGLAEGLMQTRLYQVYHPAARVARGLPFAAPGTLTVEKVEE